MAACTLYAQERIQNALFTGGSLSPPGTWYLALFSTAQDENQTGTEIVDANYARQTIAFNAWSGGKCTNNGNVTFASSSGLAGSITVAALGLMDSLAGGQCWEFDNLGVPVDFVAGQSPRLVDATLEASIT